MASSNEEMASAERIFKRFDTNGDGKISSSELADALRAFGSTSDDAVQQTMAKVDTDGDGFIDFKEFMEFNRANPDVLKRLADKI